jgi:surface carbohydrate biosynthesis protein
MPRYLLLPVEVKARELQAKAYLALMAARAGWTVLLAHSVVLQQIAPLVPPAIYLEKNIFPAREALFSELKAAGHRILAWDEEAIAIFNYDWYVAKNVQPHMLELVDAFLTWGERDRDEIARRHPQYVDRLMPTGNPRADLLRPEHRSLLATESNPYRARYGDYLLMLSSFSRVNTYGEGVEDYVANVRRASKLDDATSDYFLGALRHVAALFDEFRAVLPVLSAAFPDRQIVVRPHPAEIMDTWLAACAGLPNVHVVREGTAVGWIDGAAAVIQNGCTTGIEAFLMGRLPIAYRPITSTQFDIALPNALSLPAYSAPELVALAEAEMARLSKTSVEREEYRQRVPIVAPVVCSIHGPLATERLLAIAEQFRQDDRGSCLDIGRIRRTVGMADAKAAAVTAVKEPLRRLKSTLARTKYSPAAMYARQKYEGTGIAELNEFKTRLIKLRPALEQVAIREVIHDCFLFEARTA